MRWNSDLAMIYSLTLVTALTRKRSSSGATSAYAAVSLADSFCCRNSSFRSSSFKYSCRNYCIHGMMELHVRLEWHLHGEFLPCCMSSVACWSCKTLMFSSSCLRFQDRSRCSERSVAKVQSSLLRSLCISHGHDPQSRVKIEDTKMGNKRLHCLILLIYRSVYNAFY